MGNDVTRYDVTDAEQGIPVSLCDLKRNLRHRAILRCDVDCVELVFYYRTTYVPCDCMVVYNRFPCILSHDFLSMALTTTIYIHIFLNLYLGCMCRSVARTPSKMNVPPIK